MATWRGCRRPRTTSRQRLEFGVKPHLLGMANLLGPFSGASDRYESLEQVGGAVEGQGQLIGVQLNCNFGSKHSRDLIFVSNQSFSGTGRTIPQVVRSCCITIAHQHGGEELNPT